MNPIDPRKLQHVYSRHAADFSITGRWSPARGALLEAAIQTHVNDPNVHRIVGTYRGTIQVTHHYNPTTHLNVMADQADNLVSGWVLSPSQVAHLLTTGNIR